jgi:hypothetical protein
MIERKHILPERLLVRRIIRVPILRRPIIRRHILPEMQIKIDREIAKEQKRLSSFDKRKAYRRERSLREKGWTTALYDAVLESQNGVCKICNEPPGKTRLHADHCKDHKQARGILCGHCNRGMGFFQHHIPLLEETIVYLRHHMLRRLELIPGLV